LLEEGDDWLINPRRASSQFQGRQTSVVLNERVSTDSEKEVQYGVCGCFIFIQARAGYMKSGGTVYISHVDSGTDARIFQQACHTRNQEFGIYVLRLLILREGCLSLD
jgi:hypothetical protein